MTVIPMTKRVMETFEKPTYSVQIVLQSYNAEVTVCNIQGSKDYLPPWKHKKWKIDAKRNTSYRKWKLYRTRAKRCSVTRGITAGDLFVCQLVCVSTWLSFNFPCLKMLSQTPNSIPFTYIYGSVALNLYNELCRTSILKINFFAKVSLPKLELSL
jgi:hypothetical protein